jgi:hypothetical protein
MPRCNIYIAMQHHGFVIKETVAAIERAKA